MIGLGRAAGREHMRRFDAIVTGGGLVGTAIGYGLTRAGLKVVLLDEGDVTYRTSRGNFGLVWVPTKGLGAPHYQRWTRRSAEEWPLLAVGERTGLDVGLEQKGGVQLCLGEAELAKRRAMMEQMRAEAGNFGFEYRRALPPGRKRADPGRRGHRVRLRGSLRRPDPPSGTARRDRPQSSEGIPALRHGALPGTRLRADCRDGHRESARRTDRGGWELSPACALQADHHRHARRSGGRPKPFPLSIAATFLGIGMALA
jgi:hypothetical protein